MQRDILLQAVEERLAKLIYGATASARCSERDRQALRGVCSDLLLARTLKVSEEAGAADLADRREGHSWVDQHIGHLET